MKGPNVYFMLDTQVCSPFANFVAEDDRAKFSCPLLRDYQAIGEADGQGVANILETQGNIVYRRAWT